MTFDAWLQNGWLQRHRAAPAEVASLLAVIDRDLRASADARLDPDWRFAIAYNAALQAAAVALRAAGYETPKGGGAHFRIIESLRLTIGDDGTIVTPMQAFRAKRAGALYEQIGIASHTEADELRRLAVELRRRVILWMKDHHAGLVPPEAQGPRPR